MFNRQKHEIILRNILRDIYCDRLLGPILGFKGGTACYIFYDLDRFSMVLDFNLLEILRIEEVFERMKSILEKYGDLIEQTPKRNTIIFVLSYDKKAPNIKIEISKRDFGDIYEIKSLLGISIPVMKKNNMFAHKLAALTDRKKIANRDLFDIYWFFKNSWDINSEIIFKRTNKHLLEYLEYLVDFVAKKVNNKYILNGLGEILDEKQKIWIKKNLIKELLFQLRNHIEVLKKTKGYPKINSE